MYLTIGVFATTGVMITSYQFGGDRDLLQQAVTPKDQEVVTMANSQSSIVCWEEIETINMIVCATDTAFCFKGWHQGSPYPRQCTITLP